MIIGRFIGWVLLLVAGAVLIRDTLVWSDGHVFAPLSLGGLWSDLSAMSMIAVRHGIEDRLPWLWNFGLGPVLAVWALPIFAVLAIALLVTCRREQRRRFR